MIYLIQTIYHITKTNSPFRLLKIGYTEDSKKKSRYIAYRLHNPLFEVLYEIPNATEDDERKVHNHFQKYQYQGYGREWFVYNEEIIDFFKVCKTSQDIQIYLPDAINTGKKRKLRFPTETRLLAAAISDIVGDNEKEVLVKLKNEYFFNMVQLMSYPRLTYGDYFADKIVNKLEEKLEIANSPVVIDTLAEFSSQKNQMEKMKYLCQLDLPESVLTIILDRVPEYYKRFYVVLGPERCKSLGYCYTKMNRDCAILSFNKSDLIDRIFSTFSVGEKYSNQYVKETLGNIYNELGYAKTPKASDLEEYFEVKAGKLFDSAKNKWVHGIELVNKKN